ncbi:hypothetical protein ACFSQT_08365, partial [Mesorhizobium calcicola]
MSEKVDFSLTLLAGPVLPVFSVDAAWRRGAGVAFEPWPVRPTDCEMSGRTYPHCGRWRSFTRWTAERNGHVDAVRLRRKALRSIAPAVGPGCFAVVTPAGRSSAREAPKWAVDVGQGKTSVFAQGVRVAVNR